MLVGAALWASSSYSWAIVGGWWNSPEGKTNDLRQNWNRAIGPPIQEPSPRFHRNQLYWLSALALWDLNRSHTPEDEPHIAAMRDINGMASNWRGALKWEVCLYPSFADMACHLGT